MSKSTNVVTYVAALQAGVAIEDGETVTALLNLTAGWEAQIMIKAVHGTYSVADTVYVNRMVDGTNYETKPIYSFSISSAHETTDTATFSLSTGMYSIGVVASSPTVTVIIPTYVVITAVDIS